MLQARLHKLGDRGDEVTVTRHRGPSLFLNSGSSHGGGGGGRKLALGTFYKCVSPRRPFRM